MPICAGAKGNVDTIKVDALMRRKGFATGLDQAKLQTAAGFARSLRTRAALGENWRPHEKPDQHAAVVTAPLPLLPVQASQDSASSNCREAMFSFDDRDKSRA